MIWSNFIALGAAAFVNQIAVRPALASYGKWKRDPNRVQVAGRDWRGRYVPDLKIKRIERSLWTGFVAVMVLGAAVGWTIMTTPFQPVYAPSDTSRLRSPSPQPPQRAQTPHPGS